MPRKADPSSSSRRSPRRRSPAEVAALPARPSRKPPPPVADVALDSDFGLALALVPALRRRPDA